MTEDLNFPEKKIRSPVLPFNKQQARIPDLKKMISKYDQTAQSKLPGHMHNTHNRMACSNILERTLRENKY